MYQMGVGVGTCLLPASCHTSSISCFFSPTFSPTLLPVPPPTSCSSSPTSCCYREETRVVQARQSKLHSWWSNLRENNPITNCEGSVLVREGVHACVCRRGSDCMLENKYVCMLSVLLTIVHSAPFPSPSSLPPSPLPPFPCPRLIQSAVYDAYEV